MNIKSLSPYFKNVVPKHYDDPGLQHIVCLVGRDAKAIGKRKRIPRDVAMELVDAGILPPLGCRCGHCMSDHDCCGSVFACYRKVEPIRKGVRVITHYAINC